MLGIYLNYTDMNSACRRYNWAHLCLHWYTAVVVTIKHPPSWVGVSMEPRRPPLESDKPPSSMGESRDVL